MAPAELDGVRLYIVFASELPYVANGCVAGLASPRLHYLVAQHLPDRIWGLVWRSCSTITKSELARDYAAAFKAELGYTLSEVSLVTTSTIATCLHELAHAVSFDPLFTTGDTR